MDCVSCKIPINSAWTHAVKINICPACGSHIVSEEFKDIIDFLQDAISKNATNPDELVEWLISSYKVVPKGMELAPKAGNPYTGELRWANSPTQSNEFMKNAGVDKIQKNSEWAAIAQAVNNVNDGLYGSSAPPPVSEEEYPQEAPPTQDEIQAQLAAAALKKGSKLTVTEARSILNGGAELYLDPDGKPLSGGDAGPALSSDIKAAASIISNMFTADESEVLQDSRMKRLRSQYTIQNGGAGGFRRGG